MSFYPSINSITGINNSVNAVITVLNTNDLTVGQVIRINVPRTYGMLQIDDQIANIVSVGSNSYTVDIDSTNFDTFSVPISPEQEALLVPIGMQANETHANSLDDATRNIS